MLLSLNLFQLSTFWQHVANYCLIRPLYVGETLWCKTKAEGHIPLTVTVSEVDFLQGGQCSMPYDDSQVTTLTPSLK